MSHGTQTHCTYSYEVPPSATAPASSVTVPRSTPQSCPHPVVDIGSQRCLFHHFDPEYPADRVTEQFFEELATPDRAPTFAGAQLSGLQLAGETLSTSNREPIDLRGVTIKGDIDLSDARVEVPLLLDDAAITGSFIATDAEFNAPVSMVGTSVGRRMFLERASIVGGLVANDLSAGYVNARGCTVDGPTVFSGATFTAFAILARSQFNGPLLLDSSSFRYTFDVTGTVVNGPLDLTDVTIDEDLDLVAVRADDDVEATGLQVSGDTDWRHAQAEGSIDLSQAAFEGDAKFDDLRVAGTSAVFANTHFEGIVSFSTARFDTDDIEFSGARFDDDAWFTYVEFGGDASFDRATFNGHAHLRDATFERSLSLQGATTTDQAFLHGSTIHGDFTAADATFTHFQFSATVHGDADFESTRFEEGGIFNSSEFGGVASFAAASFAGGPEFRDARFTGPTSFDETEFLVEPTFEETRFAIEPDLEAARYPTPASRDLDELRRSMILARPETLRHAGFELDVDQLRDGVIIPAGTTVLLENRVQLSSAVTTALKSLDRKAWHDLFEDVLRTARTAAAQLDAGDRTRLVFGVTVNTDANGPATFIQKAAIAAVYAQRENTIEFGHLDTDIAEYDYLIPVSAADGAFEAGPSVAVLHELMTAMVRQQSYRMALEQLQEEGSSHIYTAILTVLAAAATVREGGVNERL